MKHPVVSVADNVSLADFVKEGRTDYRPIPRLAYTIPFGYEVDPEDETMLLPVQFELDALAKAKRHLKNYSYRDVAKWLTETTGRSISHMGLKKRLEAEQNRHRKMSTMKAWAAKYKKIMEEYELHANRLGAKNDT